jgi:hypothetical protein
MPAVHVHLFANRGGVHACAFRGPDETVARNSKPGEAWCVDGLVRWNPSITRDGTGRCRQRSPWTPVHHEA